MENNIRRKKTGDKEIIELLKYILKQEDMGLIKLNNEVSEKIILLLNKKGAEVN